MEYIETHLKYQFLSRQASPNENQQFQRKICKNQKFRYIAQVSLLGVQVIWTVDFQEALIKMSKEKDKTIVLSFFILRLKQVTKNHTLYVSRYDVYIISVFL